MDAADRTALVLALEELCFRRGTFRDVVVKLAFGLDQIGRLPSASARERALAELKQHLAASLKATSDACGLGLDDDDLPVFTSAMWARAASIAAAFPVEERRA